MIVADDSESFKFKLFIAKKLLTLVHFLPCKSLHHHMPFISLNANFISQKFCCSAAFSEQNCEDNFERP